MSNKNVRAAEALLNDPPMEPEHFDGLLRFAGEALTDVRLREIGDWDGATIQDAMLSCGLIEPREMTAACDPDVCRCAEYGDFPQTCLRITPLGQRAIAVFREWQDTARSSPDTPTTHG